MMQLTTQAQRRRPRGAPIATATARRRPVLSLSKGSLQRMVERSRFAAEPVEALNSSRSGWVVRKLISHFLFDRLVRKGLSPAPYGPTGHNVRNSQLITVMHEKNQHKLPSFIHR